jgi:hypothetical protein
MSGRYDQGAAYLAVQTYVNRREDMPQTKKALREHVKGGGTVWLISSSANTFGGFEGLATSLPAGTVFTVVGPDPERKRSWYANVECIDGKVKVS